MNDEFEGEHVQLVAFFPGLPHSLLWKQRSGEKLRRPKSVQHLSEREVELRGEGGACLHESRFLTCQAEYVVLTM